MKRFNKVTFLAFVLLVSGVPEAVATDESACGPRPRSDGQLDYRKRNDSDFNSWRLQDNHRNHYDPAMQLMAQGEYSARTFAELHFMLVNAWPNHYQSLQALIQFEKGSQGKSFRGLNPINCYFVWAREFAPGDANIYLIEGQYYWSRGDKKHAAELWQDAVDIDPMALDGHYNLGLYYLEKKDFELAQRHAEIAYRYGFPLEGLSRRLAAAGHPIK